MEVEKARPSSVTQNGSRKKPCEGGSSSHSISHTRLSLRSLSDLSYHPSLNTSCPPLRALGKIALNFAHKAVDSFLLSTFRPHHPVDPIKFPLNIISLTRRKLGTHIYIQFACIYNARLRFFAEEAAVGSGCVLNERKRHGR